MTLTFDNWLGIIGLLVGGVAVVYAIRLEQKLHSAKEAESRVETRFIQYMAAQEFAALADRASALMDAIRRGEWNRAPALANELGPSLAQALGAGNSLLALLEKDKLDVATRNVREFIVSLPLPGAEANLPQEQVRGMLIQCRTLVDAAGEISGRLRVESMKQTEEKKK